jgi:hypothetical protein
VHVKINLIKIKIYTYKNKVIYVIIIGSRIFSFFFLYFFSFFGLSSLCYPFLISVLSLLSSDDAKKKERKIDEEEKECRQRRSDHTYMRISWFDDAWRSKTEQTAEHFLLDTLHAQRPCEI